MENIWVSSSDTAQVDIYILWTDYSTTSFLGDQDRDVSSHKQQFKKETLLWCFHVKQDGVDNRRGGVDKPELRLFNVNNKPEQVFGDYSAQVDRQIEKDLANAIVGRAIKNKAFENLTDREIEGKLGAIMEYLGHRLAGEHWAINVKNDQATAACKKIDPPKFDNIGVKKGQGSSWNVRVGQTSFTLGKQAGNQLQISNYKSDHRERAKDGVESGKVEHDIDQDFWIKELEDATDTKYFYLVVNSLMTADKDVEEESLVAYTPKKQKMAGGVEYETRENRKIFGKRKSVTTGAGHYHRYNKKWADPLLTWGEFTSGSWLKRNGYPVKNKVNPRVTPAYLKSQGFLEWMESVGLNWLKEAGVIGENDTLKTMELHFENWALLVMNANEMEERQLFGVFDGAMAKRKNKLRKELEEYDYLYGDYIDAMTHNWDEDENYQDYLAMHERRKYSLLYRLLR